MDLNQTRKFNIPDEQKKTPPPDPEYELQARQLMAWYELLRKRWFSHFHFRPTRIKEVLSDFVDLARLLEEWNIDPRDYLYVIMREFRNKPHISLVTAKKTVLIYYELQKTAPRTNITEQVSELKRIEKTERANPTTVVRIEAPNYNILACQIYLATYDDDLEFSDKAVIEWELLPDKEYTRVLKKYPYVAEKLNGALDERNAGSGFGLHHEIAVLGVDRTT